MGMWKKQIFAAQTGGPKTVMVTEDMIEAGRSVRGGWNRRQLAALGVSWPLVTGWKQKLIGTTVTEDQAAQFLRLRGTKWSWQRFNESQQTMELF